MKPAMKEERKGEETGRDNVDWEVCQYQNEQLHELSLKCRKDKHYRRRIKARRRQCGEFCRHRGVVLRLHPQLAPARPQRDTGPSTASSTMPISAATGASLNQRYQTWLCRLAPRRKAASSKPHQTW